MSIEKMLKVSMVCLKSEEESLRSFLMDKGGLHLIDTKAIVDQQEAGYEKHYIPIDTAETEQKIIEIMKLIDTLNKFFPDPKGFIDLFTTPTLFVTREDVFDVTCATKHYMIMSRAAVCVKQGSGFVFGGVSV